MHRITTTLLLLLSFVLLTGFMRTVPVFADEVVASDQKEIQFELYETDEVAPTGNDGSGNAISQFGGMLPKTGSLLYGTSAFLGTLLIGFVGLMYLSRRQKK
ncbi:MULTISPECIES: LPXTG cell wall anchor domain-containing protein [unclassified Enterococcus]|uniref:LPXTG cell wall anchor domain-containing protein n=1 Tax=unclassified Enterococcus TaxID=2608891 RepID=UPI001A9B0DCA|nr:LPXTG cell wall anchor domain-containing protein [Enterococcus sp. DIV1271a]MBO1301281.1 LPXTG cell wall anchor domain-containing protein [Enterococcus sp. DIV1271a]